MTFPIILLLIIVGIKAIFSAGDTAFTYINRTEIKLASQKDKKAEKIRILMEDSNKFYGIIEVVINMSELLASAVVSLTILEYFAKYLEIKGFTEVTAMLISVAVITVILAYVMLVFGSVLPKRIARNNPKKVAYKLIPILCIVAKLNYPFERLIDITTDFFSKIFKIKKIPDERITEKQLKMLIKEAKNEGVLEYLENRILLNTLKANDITVNKIMIPLEKSYLINIDDDFSKIVKNIEQNRYTRIPVYQKEKNNIIGIFNVKEAAIRYAETGIKTKEQIKEILKIPQYIDQNEKIFNVFKSLQKNNRMMGIVCNENDMPIGLISVEDILEKLVGKIFDEDDKVSK